MRERLVLPWLTRVRLQRTLFNRLACWFPFILALIYGASLITCHLVAMEKHHMTVGAAPNSLRLLWAPVSFTYNHWPEYWIHWVVTCVVVLAGLRRCAVVRKSVKDFQQRNRDFFEGLPPSAFIDAPAARENNMSFESFMKGAPKTTRHAAVGEVDDDYVSSVDLSFSSFESSVTFSSSASSVQDDVDHEDVTGGRHHRHRHEDERAVPRGGLRRRPMLTICCGFAIMSVAGLLLEATVPLPTESLQQLALPCLTKRRSTRVFAPIFLRLVNQRKSRKAVKPTSTTSPSPEVQQNEVNRIFSMTHSNPQPPKEYPVHIPSPPEMAVDEMVHIGGASDHLKHASDPSVLALNATTTTTPRATSSDNIVDIEVFTTNEYDTEFTDLTSDDNYRRQQIIDIIDTMLMGNAPNDNPDLAASVPKKTTDEDDLVKKQDSYAREMEEQADDKPIGVLTTKTMIPEQGITSTEPASSTTQSLAPAKQTEVFMIRTDDELFDKVDEQVTTETHAESTSTAETVSEGTTGVTQAVTTTKPAEETASVEAPLTAPLDAEDYLILRANADMDHKDYIDYTERRSRLREDLAPYIIPSAFSGTTGDDDLDWIDTVADLPIYDVPVMGFDVFPADDEGVVFEFRDEADPSEWINALRTYDSRFQDPLPTMGRRLGTMSQHSIVSWYQALENLSSDKLLSLANGMERAEAEVREMIAEQECPEIGEIPSSVQATIHSIGLVMFVTSGLVSAFLFLVWLIQRYMRTHACASPARTLEPSLFSILLKTALIITPIVSSVCITANSIMHPIEVAGICQRISIVSLLIYIASLGLEIRSLALGIRTSYYYVKDNHIGRHVAFS